MNYGKYIYTILSHDATVSSLVGTRIYPVTIEQEAVMPAIAYTKKLTPVMCHGGYTVINAEFTIYCFHTHPDDLDALCLAVRGAMDAAGRTTIDTVTASDMVWLTQDHEVFDKDLNKFYSAIIYNLTINQS